MNATPNNFLGLPEDYSSHENSRVAIVPVPYEATTSYGKGTAKGPAAVIEASSQVELFDEELWVEPYKVGIQTAEAIHLEPQTSETKEPFGELCQALNPFIAFNKFPIVVGGEHSLSLGAVKACIQCYPDLSILQIDAHADCRSSFEGNAYSHACVSYHIYKCLPQPLITQVGVRSIALEEVTWLEEEKPNINIYWAHNQDKWNFHDIVSTLSNNVYLTIDVDGLDCGVMPATGTPQPGGMSWYQLMGLLKQLCVRKNVVAADIVEFAPQSNNHAPTFLIAKLIYKLIGYRFALELGVSKKYL